MSIGTLPAGARQVTFSGMRVGIKGNDAWYYCPNCNCWHYGEASKEIIEKETTRGDGKLSFVYCCRFCKEILSVRIYMKR